MKTKILLTRLLVLCMSITMTLTMVPVTSFAETTEGAAISNQLTDATEETPDSSETPASSSDVNTEEKEQTADSADVNDNEKSTEAADDSAIEESENGQDSEEKEAEENADDQKTDIAPALKAEKKALPKAAPKAAGPADLSEYVDVTSLSLTRVDTGEEVTLLETKSENESDYPVKVAAPELTYRMVLGWNLHLPDGQTIKEGDTLAIPLSCKGLDFLETAVVPLTAGDGTVIGSWNMTSKAIKVTFNENANNRSSVTDASFDTGDQAIRRGRTTSIIDFSPINTGNLTRYLCREASQHPEPVSIGDTKIPRDATNGMVTWWGLVNSTTALKLWNSAGANSGTVYKNYIYEDEFRGAKAIRDFQIYPFLRYPAYPFDRSKGLSGTYPNANSVKSYFTKLTPAEGESYSAFRARIEAQKLSYGFYTGEDSITVVINYGDLGTRSGLKYSDTQSSGVLWMSDSSAFPNWYFNKGWEDENEENRAEILANMAESYGDSNAIGGHIASYRSVIQVEYDPVYGAAAVETIDNTDYRQWEGGSTTRTRAATLKGVASTINLTSHSMAVYKYDSESNRAIEGASFKLQLWNGSDWVDYTAGDGGEMIRQTNEQGVATFNSLGNGKYRVVETKAAKGYALPVLKEYDATDKVAYFDEFTMSDTEDTYTANVANIKATVNVSATKSWDDDGNKYNKRPENITLDIYKVANGKETKLEGESKQISKDASGPDLTVSWKDMDLYDEGGNKLTYTVKEQAVPFYDTKIEQATGSKETLFKVTNTIRKDVVTLKDKTVTYNGSAQSLAAGKSEKKGTVKYSTDNKTWSDKMPTFTDAGKYTVYAKTDDGSDYIGSDVTSAVLTIEKADLKVTVKGNTDSKVYTGKEQSVTGYELTIPQGATLKESEIKGPSKTAKGTDVDGGSNADKTYPMGLAAADFSTTNKNYNVTFEVTDGWLKITPAAVKVTAEDKEKTYGDKDPDWTATAEGLVKTTEKIGDLITLTFTREPGEKAGEYKITVSGPAASGNYTFTYEQGKLTITSKAITITADSAKKAYDGKALTKDTVTTEPALAKGDKIDSVTVTGSQTAVGKSDNVASNAKIVNAAGEDVTSSYNITYAKGSLEVTAKAVTITADSDKKVYDGKALTKNTVTTAPALAEGDKIDSVTVTGSQTAVGKSDNVPSNAKIVNAAGKDVTASYKITYAKGSLEVTAKPITITADSDKKVYDGKALTKSTYTSAPALADGDKIDSVTVTGSQTTVGKSDNVPSKAKIVNAAGKDVTSNYDITYKNGALEVTAKAITITADSDKKVYDGKALTKGTVKTAPALAEGDKLGSIVVKGSQTTAGKSDNVPSGAKIVNAAGKDVTASYKITYAKGVLEVTTKPITITADSDKKVYDGKELTKNTYTTDPALAEGDKFDSMTVTGSQTAVGKSDNVASNAKIVNAAGENVTASYKITYAKGELEVTAKPITITADSDKKVYDGNELTKDTVTTDPELAEGDKLDSVTVTGSQTDVGKSDNVPSDAKILNAADEDATSNYDITYANGELEVTPAELTVEITGNTDSKVCNKKEQSVTGYEVSIPEGVNFTEEDIVFNGSAVAKGTAPGTYPMGLTAEQFGNTNKNYDVTFKVTDGELEITPIPTAKITYDLNGGSYNGSKANIVETHEIGEVISIHAAPTREGYEFSNWRGSVYQPGDSYTVTGDHTFTAVWVAAADDSNKTDNNNNPEKPGNTDKSSKGVKTGDDTNTGLWIALLLAAATGLTGTALYRRRKED